MASAPDVSVTLVTAEAAREDEIVHRPLFEGASDDVPVAALLEDGEPFTADRLDALGIEVDDAFAEALEELGDREADWVLQTIPIKGGAGLVIAVRAGEEALAVELLLPDKLEAAAALLGAKELAIAIPSSSSLLVTDAGQKWQLVAAFAAAARMQHAGAGDSALWPGVLRAEGGRITGVIDLRTASLDAASRRPTR
jgi:hypothetical protein